MQSVFDQSNTLLQNLSNQFVEPYVSVSLNFILFYENPVKPTAAKTFQTSLTPNKEYKKLNVKLGQKKHTCKA